MCQKGISETELSGCITEFRLSETTINRALYTICQNPFTFVESGGVVVGDISLNNSHFMYVECRYSEEIISAKLLQNRSNVSIQWLQSNR